MTFDSNTRTYIQANMPFQNVPLQEPGCQVRRIIPRQRGVPTRLARLVGLLSAHDVQTEELHSTQ
jgi:hypothetical protein